MRGKDTSRPGACTMLVRLRCVVQPGLAGLLEVPHSSLAMCKAEAYQGGEKQPCLGGRQSGWTQKRCSGGGDATDVVIREGAAE